MNTRDLFVLSAALLILLCGSYKGKAQKPQIYSFDVVDSITGYSSFNAVSVIDQRINTTGIGHLRKTHGPMGVFTIEMNYDLATSTPLPQTLSDLAAASIRPATKGEDTLLMVLQHFLLEIDPVTREEAIFHFHALLFIGKADSYKFLAEADTLLALKGAEIVNQAVLASSNIIFDYFRLAAGTNPQTLSGESYSFHAAADLLATLRRNTPIYHVQTFQRGIYVTGEDFLNNKPSVEAFLQQDHFVEDRNRPYFYYRNEKGKKGEKVTSAFAIYNGERWYKRYKGQWTQFTFRNEDFYMGRDMRFNIIKKRFMPVGRPFRF